jgi:hypothetical protein
MAQRKCRTSFKGIIMTQTNFLIAYAEIERFQQKIIDLSQDNIRAEPVYVEEILTSYNIYDEENHSLFKVSTDTPPISVVIAWRAIVHESNIAYQRGRADAFKQLR